MISRKRPAGRAGARGLSLTLAALLAFAIVGVSSASAYESRELFTTPSINPSVQRNWGTGALPGWKLTGTRSVTMSLGGEKFLYQSTLAGSSVEWSASGIECADCKIENRAGTGANTGSTEAVFSGTPKLTGVKWIGPGNCVMPSTLTLQPLTGVMGGRSGSSTVVAASLAPTSGTGVWANYELTGCSLAGLYKWTGTAFGRFTNALGVAAKNQQFSLNQYNQEDLGKYNSLQFAGNAVFLTGSINMVAEEEYEVKEAFGESGPNLFTTPSTSPLIPRNWYTGASPGTKLAGTQTVQSSLASENLTFNTTVFGLATKFTASGIECLGCKIENRAGTGENVGKTEAVFTGELLLNGMKMLSPTGCSMASTLKTKAMVGVIGGEKGSATKATLRLGQKEGTGWIVGNIELTGASCPIAGPWRILGNEFGEFANPLGVNSKTQRFRLSQSAQENLGSPTSLKFGENALIVNGEVNLTSETEFQVKEQ